MWSVAASLPESLSAQSKIASTGCILDLCHKHLLAFNLRRLQSLGFAPRSYYLAPPASGDGACAVLQAADEHAAFRADFLLSEVAAVLKCAGEKTATRGKLGSAAVNVACRAARAYLDRAQPWLVQGDWVALTERYPDDAAEATPDERSAAASMLQELTNRVPELQMSLLSRNIWILKPVAGAHGQGIGFVDGGRLAESGQPAEACMRTEKCSFRRREIGDRLGMVAQKYVEAPHLLDIGFLHEPGDVPKASSERHFHKYSLRFWVDVRWVASCPEAWFYEAGGYIQVANAVYQEDLSESSAHVCNLAQLPRDTPKGVASRRPRMFSLDAYRQALDQQQQGSTLFDSHLLPQITSVTARALSSVVPCTEGSKTWQRIGVDLIVDSAFNVWLIELNHKSGMGAPSGRKGDMLHSLLRTFFDAERALRSWRNDVEGRDAAAACLGMTGEHAFGFVRLFMPSWVSSEANLPSS